MNDDVKNVDIADSLIMSDEILIHLKGEAQERLMNIRPQGNQASGEFSDSPPSASWVRSSFTGDVRCGEEGNERICNILIVRLNREGSHWSECVSCEERDSNVDCKAVDGDKELFIQVTRAQQGDFWRRARGGDGVVDYSGKQAAADELHSAIEAKIKVKFASPAARSKILLALDTTETVGFVLKPVIDSFRERYGAWAKGLGFVAIWLVGPDPDFTERLDWI